MEINNYSSVGLRTAADVASEENADNQSLGQDDFMLLMTEQLKNQDPLEPMDNGEFLAQIAQFGTVDGINKLLENFDSFASGMQSSQALQASNLIGRNVLVDHDEGYLSSTGTVQGAVELNNTADVAVNIYDLTGEVVNRIEMGQQSPGLVQFNWDGTTFSGQRAASGRYRVEVEATRNGETESMQTLMSSNVVSLTLGGVGKEMKVELENLGQVDFSHVYQIL